MTPTTPKHHQHHRRGRGHGREIHRILCEQGPERRMNSVRNYLAQMEAEGLVAHRLVREGTTRFAMWRVTI